MVLNAKEKTRECEKEKYQCVVCMYWGSVWFQTWQPWARKPGQDPWEGLQGEPSRQKEEQRPVPRGDGVGKRSRKGWGSDWGAGRLQKNSDFYSEKVGSHWRDLGFSRFDLSIIMDFPGGSDGKASTCNAGDLCSIPGSGRSPGEGNDNPLQYSCLENPMDRGDLWATAHGATKSKTWATNTFPLLQTSLGALCQLASVSQVGKQLLLACNPGSVLKNSPASVGDRWDMDSIPGSGRSPGEGNGNPLQYSCLENPTDGGDW